MNKTYSVKVYDYESDDPLFVMGFPTREDAMAYINEGNLDMWFDNRLHYCNVYQYEPIMTDWIFQVLTVRPFDNSGDWAVLPFTVCVEEDIHNDLD